MRRCNRDRAIGARLRHRRLAWRDSRIVGYRRSSLIQRIQKQEFNTEITKPAQRTQSEKSWTPINGKLHSPHGHDNCLQGPKKGVDSAEYCAFTRGGLHRYNLSTSMARQRHNPAALDNPKISIVIPVYNEKSTIDRKSTRLNSSHSQISYAVF